MELSKKLEWMNGNPGALDFLMELEDLSNDSEIVNKLERCPSIRGSQLHILYSDLCNCDMNKVMQLCLNCPDEVLIDACSREDYSGESLVKQYLEI